MTLDNITSIEKLILFKKQNENAQIILDNISKKFKEFLLIYPTCVKWSIEIKNDRPPYHEMNNLDELIDIIRQRLIQEYPSIDIYVVYKKSNWFCFLWLCKPIQSIKINFMW